MAKLTIDIADLTPDMIDETTISEAIASTLELDDPASVTVTIEQEEPAPEEEEIEMGPMKPSVKKSEENLKSSLNELE